MFFEDVALSYDGRVDAVSILMSGGSWVDARAKHAVGYLRDGKVVDRDYICLNRASAIMPYYIVIGWHGVCGLGIGDSDSTFGCIDAEFGDYGQVT